MSDKAAENTNISKEAKQHRVRINKILKRREAVKKELKELYRAKEPNWSLIFQKQKEFKALIECKKFVSEHLRD